jgi:diguanylate cyclase (GGDEF)-like protein
LSRELIEGLGELATQRFGSFSDAARAVLSFLERHLPEGRLVLGEFNFGENEYRLLEVRDDTGGPFATGMRLSLQDWFCLPMSEDRAPALTGVASADPVYGPLPLRQSLEVESYIGAAVELADGTRVASVCAMSKESELYSEADLALLRLAARLLAYEWERVTREASLRRLMREQGSPAGADPVTGLPDRAAFLEHVEREWHACRREITEAYLVAVRIDGLDEMRKLGGQALRDLALRTAAELLISVKRRTDMVARVGDEMFAAVLVGCKGVEGAEAYCARLQAAFGRSSSSHLEGLGVSSRIEALADARSGTAALEHTEERLRDADRVHAAGATS